MGQPLSGLNGIVSNTLSTSYGASLAMDSKGNPNIAWYDYDSGTSPYGFDIYFVKWDGSSWVNVSGAVYDGTNARVSNTTSSSEFPCLKLDRTDRPCITWSEGLFGGFDVMFVRWDGAQWVGANGLPYNPVSGANANVSMNPGYSGYPSMDIDSNNNPCIAWHDYTYSVGTDFICVRWNGLTWVGGNGLPFNNVTGANGIVARSAFIPNGTTTSRMASKMTSVDFDSNDQMRLAFWANISGIKGIYYVKTTSPISGWLGANGQPFDSITGQNGWTGAGIQCVYTNYAYAVSLDHDRNDIPFVSWYTQTQDYYTVSLIKFAPLTATRSLRFSVKVDTNPGLATITNTSTFNHMLDAGVPLSSDAVNVNLGDSKTTENTLSVVKTSASYSYNIDDKMEFVISVTNNSNESLSNVSVTDVFPKELEFVSSQPSGQSGLSMVRFSIGNLNPGSSQKFKLTFKLDQKTQVLDCITLINEAIAQSDKIVSKDVCKFMVCSRKSADPLALDIKWKGIDTKTGIGFAGTPIIINVKVIGGASPYNIMFDWGSGRTSINGQNDGEKIPVLVIDSLDPGEYHFAIKCVDAYGSTRIVNRNVTIR